MTDERRPMWSGPEAVAAWLTTAAAEFEAKIDELDDLDAAIGDGDHGTNMARGLATAAAISPMPEATAGQYLRQVGMALVSSVGGASGPLYGTFFLRVAQFWQSPYTVQDIARALRAGADGIAARGRAKPGDKTMLDALLPAVETLEAAVGDDQDSALRQAVAAARAGAEATTGMLARRGRAAHFKERSLGHLDPGAKSMEMILDSAANHLR